MGEGDLLRRGELVRHFDVKTVDGNTISYADVWQRRNLVLVTLPEGWTESARSYASALAARAPQIRTHDAALVVTRDDVPGLTSPGVLVADRWGEIALVASGPDVSGLPDADEIVSWLEYLQSRCPECEGEAR